MREAFPELTDDVAATREAMLPGITSGPGQGNGLAGIEGIARLAGGEISVMSGGAFGQLRYGDGVSSTWQPVTGGVEFRGTAVTLSIPLDVEVDLREAVSAARLLGPVAACSGRRWGWGRPSGPSFARRG